MILYKNHQNQFLIPVFLGMIMVLLNIVPVMSYFNTKATNTDSLPVVAASKKMEKIATIDKADIGEIEVPVLGGSNNVSVASSSTYVAPAVSACANTPTPGYNQLSVCGRIIPLYYSAAYARETPPNGMAAKWTKGNFIFGNNSYNVFGGLHTMLQAGDPIIVNMEGVESVYHFSHYWINDYYVNGVQDVDPSIKQKGSTSALGLMTCAPWENVNHTVGARFDFLFTK